MSSIKKRFLSLGLAVVLVLTMIPMFSVFAADTADYTAVNQAIASIPEELMLAYTPESVMELTRAQETVVRDLPATEQAKVDSMAAEINKAVAGLVHLHKGWNSGGKWWTYGDDYGCMQKGWVLDAGQWYFMNDSGIMATGWRQVNGVWYYLSPQTGAMASNEWIGGYWLNGDGSWTYHGIGTWKHDSRGWWFEDTYGWYASAGPQKIDGVVYHFDDSGYLIY